MKKIGLVLSILLLVAISLPACTTGPQSTGSAADVVEEYLGALVEKNENRLSSLVCGDWEADALLELDSLQAVETRLEGLSCQVTGTENDVALVTCAGQIIATYNNEDQELDLSVRTYQVVEQGGETLVCGYR
ncbi:MAG: hypothetical protein ABIJ39_05590 [Chloroflexota bacterium]